MAEYMKHTGGSVAGKSKKPYDAMVYKDADSGYTIAVDSDGNVIKKVLSSANTDDVVIQAAIDSVSSGGCVELSHNTYNINSTIQTDNEVLLQGNRGVVLQPVVDTNVIQVNKGSRILGNGTIIDCRNLSAGSYTSSCIFISGSQYIIDNPPSISGLEILCGSSLPNHPGSAIHLKSYQVGTDPRQYICFVKFDNITIDGNFEYGIRLDVNGTGATETNFINGCTFSNISIWKTIRPIYMYRNTDSYAAITGNTFNNIQICQSTTPGYMADYGIYCSGANNIFKNIVIWDGNAAVDGNGLYFDNFSYGNYFSGYLDPHSSVPSTPPYFNDITNLGEGNIIKIMRITNYIIVSRVGDGDFLKLSDALSSITNAASDNRYVIEVRGNIYEDTSGITAKSYVDVFGADDCCINININNASTGITFSSVTSTTWKNIKILRITDSSCSCVLFTGSSNNITIRNIDVTHNGTATYSYGLNITGTSNNINIDNCNVTLPNASTGSHGLYFESTGDNIIINNSSFTGGAAGGGNGGTIAGPGYCIIRGCSFYGGSGGNNSYGLYIAASSSCNIYNSVFQGGNAGTGCHGIYLGGSSHPGIHGCVAINGNGNTTCYGIYVDGNSSPIIQSCVSKVGAFSSSHTFTGSNATIQPFAGKPYFVESMYVYVSVAGAGGSTLNIGTTAGGNEIASGIPTSTTGTKYFAINRSAILADAPIYLTFSDTNTIATVYYVVKYNYSGNYALYFNSYGSARISNCKFYSNQASPAGYITTIARTAGKFLIENCNFESVGTYDLEGQTSGVVPVYNCTFARGSLSNVTLPGQGTAATITAGNTYVDVTHSLPYTPTKVRVTPTTNLGTRSFWVDTKGATTFRININSTDIINHTFDWEAEV